MLGTNSIGYKNSVNTSALCGFTDWRMPTVDELVGILDRSQATSYPKIDSTWFPNTRLSWQCAHSLLDACGRHKLYRSTDCLFHIWGQRFDSTNRHSKSVRLVRCGAVSPATCTSN